MPLSPGETLKERRGGRLGAAGGPGWPSCTQGVEVHAGDAGSHHTVTRDTAP